MARPKGYDLPTEPAKDVEIEDVSIVTIEGGCANAQIGDAANPSGQPYFKITYHAIGGTFEIITDGDQAWFWNESTGDPLEDESELFGVGLWSIHGSMFDPETRLSEFCGWLLSKDQVRAVIAEEMYGHAQAIPAE